MGNERQHESYAHGTMMRCSVWSVVLLGFVAQRSPAAVWQPAGPNLLSNGGFERGMAEWSIAGEKAAVACDEAVVHAGKRSLRIAATGRAGETRAIGFAMVDAAKKYRVTFAAKTSGLCRDPRLSAEFHGEMAAAVGLAAYAGDRWLRWCPRPEGIALTGTSDWRTFSFDVLHLPAETRSIQLHLILHNGARGTVWFDDVSVQELNLRWPSLVLSTAAPANIFTAEEAAGVEARIRNGATGQELRLRWQVHPSVGHSISHGERRLRLRPGEERTEVISLGRSIGHFVVGAELVGGKECDRDRLETAVVPDPSRSPCPSLGLWGGDAALVRKAGASWTRVIAYWRYLEPHRGEWNWDALEPSLKEAKAAGLKVLLCFAQTAAWASSAPSGHADFGNYPPKRWQDLAEFAEAVARRFGQEVDAWEIWNEPVIPWGWKGSAEDVVLLHRTVHDAIRRVRPDAMILGPCICQGTFPLLKLPAFQNVLSLGILKYCDGLAIHPYREPLGPEHTFFFEELGRLQAFAGQHGIQRGIWITEIGWSSSDYPFWPKRKVSELEQAAYLARSAVAAVAAGVRLFNWHALTEWDVPDPYQEQFGIVRAENAGPKPAYVAYAVCAHYLAGARYVGRLVGVGPPCPADRASSDKVWNGLRPACVHSIDGYRFDRAGEPWVIAWSISGREETLNLTVTPQAHAEDALGTVVRLHPWEGKVSLRVSDLPVYVTNAKVESLPSHGR